MWSDSSTNARPIYRLVQLYKNYVVNMICINHVCFLRVIIDSVPRNMEAL